MFAQAISSTSPTGREHHHQRIAGLAHQVVLERHDHGSDLMIGVGECLFQPRSDERHVGVSLLNRDPGLQPADGVERVASTVAQAPARHIQRGPQLRLKGEAEAGRHHTNDRVLARVQLQRLPHGFRVSSEAALPEGVAEDHDVILARLVLARRPGSAQDRIHAEQGEEIGFRRDAPDMVGLPLAAEVHLARPKEQGHVGKRAVLRFPVDEIRPGEGILAGRGLGFVKPDQAVRIGIGERAQQDGIDDAEDGGVGPNAGGQGQDGYRRESTGFEQGPDGVPQVLNEGSHEFTLSTRRAQSLFPNLR